MKPRTWLNTFMVLAALILSFCFVQMAYAALATPSVGITSPSNNAQYTVGQTVTIKGTGVNCDHIALFVDGSSSNVSGSIQTGNTYSYNYPLAASGTHTLQLKGRNAADGVAGSTLASSQIVTIKVVAPLPTPSVSITSPSNNAQYTVGQTVSIKGTGVNCDHISLFVDGSNISGSNQAGNTYSYNYPLTAAGTHTLQLKGRNAAEGVAGSTLASSQIVTITVAAPLPTPSVSITSPSNNAQYTVGQTATIKGTGVNCDHISLFVDGSNISGSNQTGNIYSYNYPLTAAGTHTLQLKGRNAAEGVAGSTLASSQIVTINVVVPLPAPSVSITSPSNNAQYAVGQTVTIKGTGVNCDHIALFVDGSTSNVSGSIQTGNSYSYNYLLTVAGTHTLQLKGRNAADGVIGSTLASSQTVTINVVEQPAGSPTATGIPATLSVEKGKTVKLAGIISCSNGLERVSVCVDGYTGGPTDNKDRYDTRPTTGTWSNQTSFDLSTFVIDTNSSAFPTAKSYTLYVWARGVGTTASTRLGSITLNVTQPVGVPTATGIPATLSVEKGKTVKLGGIISCSSGLERVSVCIAGYAGGPSDNLDKYDTRPTSGTWSNQTSYDLSNFVIDSSNSSAFPTAKTYTLYIWAKGAGTAASTRLGTISLTVRTGAQDNWELVQRAIANVTGDSTIITAQGCLVVMDFPLGKSGTNKNGVDGKYGQTSKYWVMEFQHKKGINNNTIDGGPDGILDATTTAKLETSVKSGENMTSLGIKKRSNPKENDIIQAINNKTTYLNSQLKDKKYTLPAIVGVATARTESGMRQFNDEGSPGPNASNDWGIMQLNRRWHPDLFKKAFDNEAGVVHNWKDNVNAGVSILQNAYKVAVDNNEGSKGLEDDPADNLARSAYSIYNCNHSWRYRLTRAQAAVQGLSTDCYDTLDKNGYDQRDINFKKYYDQVKLTQPDDELHVDIISPAVINSSNKNVLITITGRGFVFENDDKQTKQVGVVVTAAGLYKSYLLNNEKITLNKISGNLSTDMIKDMGTKDYDIKITISNGNKNAVVNTSYHYIEADIIKRAYEMANIIWTPSKDVTSWRKRVTFKANEAVKGIPYSQTFALPIRVENMDKFTQIVDNQHNLSGTFYSNTYKQDVVSIKNGKSVTEHDVPMPYAGNDCSGFVSSAFGIPRHNCTGLSKSILIESIKWDEIQPGDALNKPGSHVMLYLGQNTSNNKLVMLEQTPPKIRKYEYTENYFIEKGYSPIRLKANAGVRKEQSITIYEDDLKQLFDLPVDQLPEGEDEGIQEEDNELVNEFYIVNEQIDQDNLELEITFNTNIIPCADVKQYIFYTRDGINYVSLSDSDQIQITENRLIILFNEPLIGSNNIVKIPAGILGDENGIANTNDIFTNKITANIPTPPMLNSIEQSTDNRLLLWFDKTILSNVSEIKSSILISYDGEIFINLHESDTVSILENCLIINLSTMPDSKFKIKIMANALKSSNNNILGEDVITEYFQPDDDDQSTDYQDWPEQITADSNKTWKVVFSKSLDPNSVNNDSVFIAADDLGQQKLDGIQINMNDSSPGNNNSITITNNVGGWVPETNYYLFITQGVTSDTGTSLPQPIRMKFTVEVIEIPTYSFEVAPWIEAGTKLLQVSLNTSDNSKYKVSVTRKSNGQATELTYTESVNKFIGYISSDSENIQDYTVTITLK